jgi:murein DD-endopeptidase MepM/ murein hydrolase activator NlpD
MLQKKHLIKITIPIIAIAVLLVLYFAMKPPEATDGNDSDRGEAVLYEPRMMYGFNVDTLTVVTNTIKRNEFLANILLGYNVDYAVIDRVARETKDVFDVRRMRHGNNYSVILSNDSVPRAKYFIYEISPVDYVVYSLKDSVFAYRSKKEIERRIDTATGVISSSLWNAMVANETDINLALKLSDIYAWTVDFFGIQKGDSYTVVYENLFVDDQRIGIGKVLAANFNHFRKDNWAFYFMQDSVGDYFDEEGNSLRRAFLKAPLNYRRISSGFSHSRMHPILKVRRPHLGVDYAAAHGTPVMSIGDGIVERVWWCNKGGGRSVRIKHNSVYSTAYLHLSKYGDGIKAGAPIKQGQVIGYVGSTGMSTGPHLDFRFYQNGQPVDPLKVESPPVEPVNTMNMERFAIERDYWLDVFYKFNNQTGGIALTGIED